MKNVKTDDDDDDDENECNHSREILNIYQHFHCNI